MFNPLFEQEAGQMKKALTIFSAAFCCALIFQGTASAEWIKGKVQAVDTKTNSLTVNRTNTASGAEEKAMISVKPETAYTGGVKGLAEIAAGDEVSVIAQKDADGNMKAISLRKVMIAAAPATAASSGASTAAAPVAPPAPPVAAPAAPRAPTGAPMEQPAGSK